MKKKIFMQLVLFYRKGLLVITFEINLLLYIC